MERREFLKKSSIFSMGMFTPSLLNGKTIKNKYHFIMPPKPFEYFIKEGKKKGGKILIIGGIHGNEEGSYKASDILIDTEIKQGSIAILPRSNPESIFTDMRGYNGDMNRKFSYLSKRDNDYYKINSIKNFISDYKPDVILSLHDGYGFFARHKTQWGESIVIDEANYNNIPLLQIANKVSNNLKKHHFNIPINNTKTFSKTTHHKEQRKSLTYYSLQQHNIPAFCIEASKQTSLKRKVQIHLIAMQEFFNIYNVKIAPSFEYLISQINQYIKPVNTKILAYINNEKKLIQNHTILHIPKGSEIKFEVLNNRGGGVLAKGVNANYKSFFYRNNLMFEVKNDNINSYNFIIRG
jgi:hypothetical protein